MLLRGTAGRKCSGPDGLDAKDKWSNCYLVDCPNTGNGT